MKGSMIWENTLREIRGSLGRFLAIFAIVALGVGFFSGLKITKADFLKSTTKYFEKTSFFDYRIMGSLGFSEAQVEMLAAKEDVFAAEGALYFDMYFEEKGGSRKVGRFHSITQQVNQLQLTAGRMPLAQGEILADSSYFSSSSLGKKIYFSEDNDKNTLEEFETKEFEIVGIVKSPVYLQYERGNTSLGSGSIDVFFYLPKTAFTMEDYTEIYVKFCQNFDLYSEEYDEFMKEKKTCWEGYVDQACEDRLLEWPGIMADARKTFEEKKEEAQQKLDDAEAELADAAKELDEGAQKLADGKEELEKGRKDLDEARRKLEDAKKTIEEKEPELEKGKQQLESGKKELAEKESLLKEKETELNAGKTQLEAAEMTLKLGEMQYNLTMSSLISDQASITSEREKLEERKKVLENLKRLAESMDQTDVYSASIERETTQIAEKEKELDTKENKLHQQYLDCLSVGDSVTTGRQEYEASKAKMEEGEKAILDGKEALQQGKKEFLEAEEKIEKGEAELKAAKLAVKQGEKDIEEGEKTLSEKQLEWEEGAAELEDGRQKLADGRKEYEDAVRTFEEEIGDAEERLSEQEEWLTGEKKPEGYLLGRNTNIGYVCFENDSAIVDGIANVFPVFFFMVAALVCVTTMSRMVEEQRTQIGILKALGYSDGRIMFKFLFYSGTAAFSGCVLGYIGGTHLFPFIIWTVYGIIYKAGPIAFTFNPGLAGFSLLVSLLCSVGATYLSCGRELGSCAAQLMRPRSPKAGKRVLLERIPFLWKRFSFLQKVAIRNILRYKKRLFMMVLGIGGCSALLLTGFGIKDSIAGVAQIQYTEIETYDLSATLTDIPDHAFLTKLDKLREKGMEEYLFYQEQSLELVGETTQKTVTVMTFSGDITQEVFDHYFNLQTLDAKKLLLPSPGEAILTDKIADQLQVKTGDRVILRDEEMHEKDVIVAGIARNYIGNYVFLTDASCQPKSVFIRLQEGRDIGELSSAVMKMSDVANITVTKDVITRFETMMSSLNLIVILVICCAAGLAFVVLYNLTNINITERIREIATIKVLGFYQAETALYVFRENFVLTALGALIGLGMGKWLHTFVIHEVDVDLVNFAARVFPQSYLYSLLLTIVFSVGVSMMMSPRLEKISMTESLKSVD